LRKALAAGCRLLAADAQCLCRSLKKPPGDWMVYEGDGWERFKAEGFSLAERDRAGLGKGPLRLYCRVGVGGCAPTLSLPLPTLPCPVPALPWPA